MRIGEEEIVVGGQFPAVGVVQRQHRIGVFLQVVNLVLQAGAEHLKRERLAGLGVELEVIDVLRDFDAAVHDARQPESDWPCRACCCRRVSTTTGSSTITSWPTLGDAQR